MWDSKRDGYFLDEDANQKVVAITVFYNNKVYDISANEPRFSSVYSSIKENKLKSLPKFLSNEKVFSNLGKKHKDLFSYKQGILYIQGEPVPEILGDHILNYYHKGLDYQPLVNFWEDLKNNPDNKVKQDLYYFLNRDGHAILADGSFIAYRTVNGDFKDIWTKTVDNSIGAIVKMDRKKVNADRNQSAGSGLHIATMAKAISFGSWSPHNPKVKLLAVKVFPKDVIVGIDPQGDHAYLRACQYQVIKEITDGIAPRLEELMEIA